MNDDERCQCCNRRLRYRWAQARPAEPGPALQHGARSSLVTDPLAAELAAALLEDRPDLGQYPESVRAWARAEARCVLLEDYHTREGFLDPGGNVRGGGRVDRFEAQAARLRERLGLDPLADAALRKAQAEAVHLVADLEQIRAKGRAVLERRRAELAVGEDVSGSEGVADGG